MGRASMKKILIMVNQTFLIWLKNIWDSAISGGCNATLAAVGLSAANSMGVTVTPLDYKQMGAIFLAGTALEVLRYLKSNPSPDFTKDESEEKVGPKP